MKIIDKIKENKALLFLRMLPIMCREYWFFVCNNARSGMSSNKNCLLTDILMLTHALEKAFSLPHQRKEFGAEKAKRLCSLISLCISKYGYSDSLIVPISLLIAYIDYHEEKPPVSSDIKEISSKLEYIIASTGKNHNDFKEAGSLQKNKEEMLLLKDADFKKLATQRFSVRSFSKDSIHDDILLQAIDIAKKSPSACNRQSYRVHIFRGELKNQIMAEQGGCNAFYKDADFLIVICADLNRYYSREIHLGYVDASLFGMSLIYALTYLGVANIPLTMGIKQSSLEHIKEIGDIPKNELPVLMIAGGAYPDKFSVSQSHRNQVNSFTTKHF